MRRYSELSKSDRDHYEACKRIVYEYALAGEGFRVQVTIAYSALRFEYLKGLIPGDFERGAWTMRDRALYVLQFVEQYEAGHVLPSTDVGGPDEGCTAQGSPI